MKIAHFVFNLQVSGRDLMIVNIANEQAQKEDVALFILDDLVDEAFSSLLSEKCKVYRLNRTPNCKNPLMLLRVIVRLNYLMLRYSPDIIHIHVNKISWSLLWFWPIVRTKHENNKSLTEYWRLKALFAVSNDVKDELSQRGFKSIVVLNGIRTQDIKPKVIPPKTVDNMSKSERLHFVQVGRLFITEKGQDITLDAIHILKEQGYANFAMHFIGSGASETILKKKVIEYGLEDIVIFEGIKAQEYIFKHLCDYDLLIQPSRTEAYGLTVAEAMAAKLPVIVSDIQGPMEVIGYGQYGMSFKSGDSNGLAEKLKIVLQGGYDYSLIEKAYRHVHDNYDVSITAQRYLDEYHKI